MSFRNCTAISPQCPLEATTYGYYPNFGLNIAFVVVWGIFAVAQSVLGVTYRTWSYSGVLAAGSIMEAVGYVGRIMMNSNPWTESGFRMQVICLVLAPSLLAAGVYLSVKHLVLFYGPSYSRIRPHLYTWIFIGCDLGSIVLQAIGGACAASGGKDNFKLVKIGNNIIIAGISFQVVTMAACGVLAADFYLRVRKAKTSSIESNVEPKSGESSSGMKAKLFLLAIGFAYTTILIRCIYRLPEMAGGWGNPRMRIEKEFLLLDGLMVVLATGAMTIFHPGWSFPQMVATNKSS